MHHPAHAAEVIITLPDAMLDGALIEVCRWYKCRNPDAPDPQEMADALVKAISLGHYTAGLASLDAALVVHYDRDWSDAETLRP